jgi:hypothetical protein
VIAIDWSGARVREEKKIWIAEAADGELLDLRTGLSREAVFDYLVQRAKRDSNVVVGLDFAFSAPAWFLEANALRSAAELWALCAEQGESWLSECPTPFWGRKGSRRPVLQEHFRATDYLSKTARVFPKSVFQIAGAGSVGTGSLRGWPFLHRLRMAGFSIWPFDAAGMPLVLEIYPRLLTGDVTKSSATAREAYLRLFCGDVREEFRSKGASSDDAFDAMISALAMSRCAEEFLSLAATDDPVSMLEGLVWRPRTLA